MDDKQNRIKNNNAWAGVALIIGGGLLLAYKMDAGVPGWIFSWPMILIVVGILSGIRHGFRNTSWILITIIGGLFLADRIIPGNDFHAYLFPLSIIAAGAYLVFRPKGFNSSYRSKTDETSVREMRLKVADSDSFSEKKGLADAIADDGETFRISSVFSGVNKNIFSKNFRGGTISCVFGGAEIDLTQADITSPAVIKIEQVFGGTKLTIPSHWTVQNEIEGFFHGMEDKRKYYTDNGGTGKKLLILKGSSVFAGIEIRSY